MKIAEKLFAFAPEFTIPPMVVQFFTTTLDTNEKRAMVIAAVALLFAWIAAMVYRQVVTALARSYVPFMARLLAPLLRSYSYGEDEFFSADCADEKTVKKRRAGFKKLAERFNKKFAKSAEAMGKGLSDLRFTNTNRVPFPFQKIVQKTLRVGSLVESSNGPELTDVDGNTYIDLSGSYGVNVAGNESYKKFMANGCHKTAELGCVLGPLHPIVMENVSMLKEIGLDEVSFHMSGTEAVMSAIRLARLTAGAPKSSSSTARTTDGGTASSLAPAGALYPASSRSKTCTRSRSLPSAPAAGARRRHRQPVSGVPPTRRPPRIFRSCRTRCARRTTKRPRRRTTPTPCGFASSARRATKTTFPSSLTKCTAESASPAAAELPTLASSPTWSSTEKRSAAACPSASCAARRS